MPQMPDSTPPLRPSGDSSFGMSNAASTVEARSTVLDATPMQGLASSPVELAQRHDRPRQITLPSAAFQKEMETPFALRPTSLTFKDLAFSLPSTARRSAIGRGGSDGTPKSILEPCSGHFESGELVAIMGPSGSGKTTLMDMLAMKKTAKYEGEVFLNGRTRDNSLFRRVAAYVGQDDTMPTHWTVREAVAFNAKLKREPDRSSESTAAWIDVLLETFGLSQVEDTLVGGGERVRGISGGQRRRVSLARGVAARASILFCDEPTSGLSATDAESCITALRDITKKLGVLCVVVIHQPRVEVANMFDRLLLLTANPGRMTYLGPMRDAQQFWEQHGYCVPRTVNAVDYFLDIVTPGTPFDASDALVSIFREVQQPSIDEKVTLAMQSQGLTVREMVSARDPATVKSTPATVKSTRTTRTIGSTWMTGPHSVSWGTQLAVLLARKSRMTFRSPVSVALPLIVPSLQGLVVGYMFQGIAKSEDMLRQIMFIFCLLTMLCVAGTMNLAVLIQDRTVMKYEQHPCASGC